MRTFISTFAPLGRLYDPLRGLAARIHRVLGTRHKTVSTDHLGGVFLDYGGCLALSSKRSIVGTYDMYTPLFVIEDALRLALRERASPWITDWCAQNAIVPRGRPGPGPSTLLRGRPLRARAAPMVIPLQDSVAS